jgi:hypothetical protein
MSSPDDLDARARDRTRWPVRRAPLGQEPDDDLALRTTPIERVLMMWPLARDAWILAGKPIPTYRREETPVRVIRPAAGSADGQDE